MKIVKKCIKYTQYRVYIPRYTVCSIYVYRYIISYMCFCRKKIFNAHECVGELRGKKKKIKYGSLIDKINEKKRKESKI